MKLNMLILLVAVSALVVVKLRLKAKKLARETLRAEVLASWKPDDYALNLSPLGVKAAPAREYHFAILSGMKDFWKRVPFLEKDLQPVVTAQFEADIADGKRYFPVIQDGRSDTYVPFKSALVVPKRYFCARATAEKVCDVVSDAKYQARHRDDKRDPVQ